MRRPFGRLVAPLPALALAGLLVLAAPTRALKPSDLNLEPRLFGISLLRFSSTRDLSLLEQYFRKNILKHKDLPGGFLETVDHYRTRELDSFAPEKRRELIDSWLATLAVDHPELAPALEATRLFSSWSFAAATSPSLPPAERTLLAESTSRLLAAPKVSPWGLLVAGLVAHGLETAAGPETATPGLSPSDDLWTRASAAAPSEDAHLHFVLGDLLAATLDRRQVAVFCKRVATEFEKSLLVNPGDKQLYTAVAGRYHELYEALSEPGAQLPFWFEELVFKRLISVEPTNARAHNNLSFLYSQYGVNLQEALKEAQIANQLQPNDPNMMDTLGWAHYKAGNFAKAVEVLRKALALDPGLADVHFHLASVLYDQKDYDAAVAEFRATVQLDPKNAFALNNLAYLFAERSRDLEEGLALVDRALELEPGNSAFLDTKGWLLFRLGRFDEADTWVSRAIAAQAEVSELHLHKGEIALARGRYEEAGDHFEKALTYDPKNAELARSLARIHALASLRSAMERFARIGAVRRDKRHFEAFYRAMAEVHVVDGQYDEAARILKEYAILPSGDAVLSEEPGGTEVAAPPTPKALGADLASALASLPAATDMVFTVERPGLVKLLDTVLRHAKTPFPLAAFRPQIEARLPNRIVLGMDSGEAAQGGNLLLLLHLDKQRVAEYGAALERARDLTASLPGSNSKIRLRSDMYKGRVIGEVEIPGVTLHFTLLDDSLALAVKKSHLIEFLDAGSGSERSQLAKSPGLTHLLAALAGTEDALLVAYIPELLASRSPDTLTPEELALLEKTELVASRYALDLEADVLREWSLFLPRSGASLAPEATRAEGFARKSLGRLPAASSLLVESAFGAVEDRIQGSMLIRGVSVWGTELLKRLSQVGIDLPDLDLEGTIPEGTSPSPEEGGEPEDFDEHESHDEEPETEPAIPIPPRAPGEDP